MIRKRVFLGFVMGLFLVFALSGQDRESLNEIMDFSKTLRDFTEATPSQRAALVEEQKFYLLEGALSSITVIDPDPENYYVEVELINGSWDGLEDVDMYKAFVAFLGKDYVSVFPRRISRTPGPEVVLQNSHIIVLATLYGYTEVDGNQLPVFIGEDLRVIP